VDFRSLYNNPAMTSGAGGTRTYDWGNGVSYTLTPVQIQTSWGSFTNYQQSWSQSAPTAVAAAPSAAAPAPSIAPVLDNNFSASTWGKPIPISAGTRRLPGDIIWLREDQLNTEGQYTANAAWSFGYRLIDDATATIAKIWANGIKIYDVGTGFTADGFSFAEYDGSQTTADATIVADKTAALTPAYKEQLYLRGVISTADFNGALPNISALWIDAAGGSLFRPWGGTWDAAEKSANIDLTNGDLTATLDADNTASMVRSTVSHSSGRWFFGVRRDASGATDFGGVMAWRWGFRTDVSTAGYDYHLGTFGAQTLCYDINGSILTSGLGAGSSFCSQICPLGDYIWVAVDLDDLLFWTSDDAVTFSGPTPLTGDPVTGTNPLLALQESYLGSPTEYFIAFSGYDSGDSATLITEDFPVADIGAAGALTLPDIITAVGQRCGYQASDFTFVGLDDVDVTGIVITQDTDFQSFIKNAGRFYGFDYVESGSTIKFKKSVVGSTYTVDRAFVASELMAINPAAAAEVTRAEEQTKPTVIEVLYQDETIDYQASQQRARRADVNSTIVEQFGVPFVLSAAEALTGAATALYREWNQRVSYRVKVPYTGLRIEPTDIITFPFGAVTVTAKVLGGTINSDLSQDFSAVALLTSEALVGSTNVDAAVAAGTTYAGAGASGDANTGNLPMEIPRAVQMLWPYMTITTP
jgi:hypothetical protein